jgi:hypothetical protein
VISPDWQPHTSGALRAAMCASSFMLVWVIPWIKVLVGSDGPFVSLSVAEGQALKYEVDDRLTCAPAVDWRDRQTSEKFVPAVIRLLLEKHPTSLGDTR